MHVHSSIAALRDDPAIQRRAQAAMFAVCEKWRDGQDVAPVLTDLREYGGGAPLSACPSLGALFEGEEAGGGFAQRFAASFAASLRHEPFGQLPFRHSFDGSVSTLLLARSGRAQLTLSAREPGEFECSTVHFSDATRVEKVLSGECEALLTRRFDDGGLEHQCLSLSQGTSLSLDLGSRSLFVTKVGRRTVSLRLMRTNASPGPSSEYDRESGALIGRATGAIGQSRLDLMTALLGRMARADAAPVIAEMAGEQGPPVSRWEALREALALDTASGFAALLAIARDANDPLCAEAGALRAQLVETYPQLLEWEEAQCPA